MHDAGDDSEKAPWGTCAVVLILFAIWLVITASGYVMGYVSHGGDPWAGHMSALLWGGSSGALLLFAAVWVMIRGFLSPPSHPRPGGSKPPAPRLPPPHHR